MKTVSKLCSILSDAALLFCAVFAAISAAPLTYSVPFLAKTLAIVSAGAALAVAIWFNLDRFKLIFGVAVVLGAFIVFLFWNEFVIAGARLVVLNVLSSIFRTVEFELTAEHISSVTTPEILATWFLCFCAVVFAIILGLFAVRFRKLTPSLLLPLPFLIICFVYTNIPPDMLSVFLFVIYTGGILLSFGVRKRDPQKGAIFSAAILPVLLALFLALTFLIPENTFTPIPYEQRREILGSRFGELQDGILRIYAHNPVNYDLSKEKGRGEDTDRLLFVSASARGNYLLRAHSYGLYHDNTWLAAPEYDGEWSSMEALGKNTKGSTQRIAVYGSMTDERYVPYGFAGPDDMTVGESFIRAKGETAYNWVFFPNFSLEARRVSRQEEEYYKFARAQYTMQDGEIKEKLLEIISENGVRRDTNDYYTAINVAAFVRGSGVYSLSPGETPAGEDFVIYFLTQGHKGYCVHYASATAALLQAMGIPARYTVGCYAGVPSAGEWFDVPRKNYHAWTEVYVKGVGWVPIESTPGFNYDAESSRFDLDYHGMTTPVPTAVPIDFIVSTPAPTMGPDERPDRPDTPEETVPSRPDGGETSPKPTKKPSGGVSIGGDGEGGGAKLPLGIIIPAAVILWFVVGELLRKRRERSFKSADARRGVLRMVRYYERLEKLFKLTHFREIDDLKNEAAFSQHDMTGQQAELYEHILATREEIGRRSAFTWIVFRRLLFVL